MKQLTGMIIAFVTAWLAPHLGQYGLPESVTSEIVATVAAGLFAVSAAIQWLITKSPSIHGPAMIAVAVVEETMANQPNEVKRDAAIGRLIEMIDGMKIGRIQKWLLRRAAPIIIETIVKQAKHVLRMAPPEPPRAN